jgi:hypothetical protein
MTTHSDKVVAEMCRGMGGHQTAKIWLGLDPFDYAQDERQIQARNGDSLTSLTTSTVAVRVVY